VSRSESTVEALLQLVPQVDELEVLRLGLVRAALPDPGRAWDSSSSYATVDKRILTPEDVDHALDQARDAVQQYVTFLHEGLRPVFRSFFEGDVDAAARHLIALGERHENDGRANGARRCYHSALMMVLPLADKAPQILALRRLGRVSLALGEFKEATAFYERSAELARDTEDLPSEVIALTGAGNVSMHQGRWPEAEAAYKAALALAEQHDPESLVLQRGQLYNNLGNCHTRFGHLDEADQWLARARELWNGVDSALDHAVFFLNLGHLREAQDRLPESREAYEAGVALEVPSSIKALIAADLADMCLREGHVTEAEDMARVAEEHAIASGSPYTLGYMYRNRGNLARARGDEDGFTFFEKALEIAREKGYPSLEAETLADYAELRRDTGGTEEAEAYLERARELFVHLGSGQDLRRVERVLAEIRSEREPVTASDQEEPLAAAGD
jgi:tetratricopeptide (TPR) repeat protein